MAEMTEIETDTEEDYWENVSLIVTKDIQIETDDGQNTAEPTLGNLPTNNPNEVDYDNLDQNINLANQSNLFDWDNDSFWNRDFTDFVHTKNLQPSRTMARKQRHRPTPPTVTEQDIDAWVRGHCC